MIRYTVQSNYGDTHWIDVLSRASLSAALDAMDELVREDETLSVTDSRYRVVERHDSVVTYSA